MKKAVIWDLDGTLLESYHVIVESIYLTFLEAGIEMTQEKIKEYAIRSSSSSLFYAVADEKGIDVATLFARYRQISGSKYKQITAIDGALETLQALQQKGFEHYVFTHRGATTVPVLDHLGMTDFFGEILTSRSGFARKPDPEALTYLIQKYALEPEHTYYVGDRSLDIACANNAGIAGILFRRAGDLDVSDGTEKYIVSELTQLLEIL